MRIQTLNLICCVLRLNSVALNNSRLMAAYTCFQDVSTLMVSNLIFIRIFFNFYFTFILCMIAFHLVHGSNVELLDNFSNVGSKVG